MSSIFLLWLFLIENTFFGVADNNSMMTNVSIFPVHENTAKSLSSPSPFIEVAWKTKNDSQTNPIVQGEAYDFVLEMESLNSLSVGWPINMTEEMKSISHENISVNLRIVGVLGYYSKGKSFFINQLLKEIKGQEPAIQPSSSSWLDLIGRQFFTFYSRFSWIDFIIVAVTIFARDGNRRGKSFLISAVLIYLTIRLYLSSPYALFIMRAQEAPGVTTKGISGIFVSESSHRLNESSILLLDTAGRNAPARGTSNKIDIMHSTIFGLRSKESLIDDIVLDMSDTVVYLMDEALNEDQRTILHLIEHIAFHATEQHLVLVHNFKRINCHEEETTKKLLQEQINHSFDATNKTRLNDANIFSSSWRFDLKDKSYDIEVYHAVLFNQEHCAKENGLVMKELRSILASGKRSLARKGKLFDVFAKSMSKHLDKYIKLSSRVGKAEEPFSTSDEYAKHTKEIEEKRCERDCFKLTNPGFAVELLPWERRAMPATKSESEFAPNHVYYYIENGYKMRIDLPGMQEVSLLNVSRNQKSVALSSCDKNWVTVTIDNSDEQHRAVHVLGCRKRPEADSSNVFGRFDVLFKVSYAYTNPQVQLIDGVLNIIWERTP